MFWCAPGRSNTSSTWSKTFESFQKNKKNTNFTCEHLEDKIPKDGLRKVLLSRNDMTVHHRINTTSTELRSYSGGWGNYAASKVTPSLPNSLETHVQTIRVRHCRFDQDVCLLSDSDKGHLEHESSTSSPKNSFALPSAFTALKDVVITHCCLREIPAELFSLPCLVSLNLSFNRFQSGIPSSFWKCKTLKRLELQCIEKKANMSTQVAAPFAGPADTAKGYSSATHIPKPSSIAFGRKGSTGSLPDFTHKPSKLGEFPPSPSYSSEARPPPVPAQNSFTANQTMNINGNKDEMALSYIDLTGSGVTVLSPFIGHLTNLRTLKLSQNHIRRLPTVLAQLTQLCILEIDHNPILNIPADLKAKPGLELVCGLPDMILPGLYLGDINCALNASALNRCGIQRIISVLETDGAVVHPGIDTLVIDVSDNPGSELGFQSISLPYFARFAMLPRPQRPTPAALGLILPIAEDDMNYCVLDPVLLGFDGSKSMEHFFHPPVRNDLDIQLFRSDPNDKHDEVDNETCCSSSCQSGTFTQSAVDDGTDNSDAGSACRSLSRQSSIKSCLDGLSKLSNSAHQRTLTDNNNTNELLDEHQNNLVLHEQIELYSQLWRAGGAVLHRLPTPIYDTPRQTESIHATMHRNEPQFCVLASDEPQLGIDYTQAPRIEIHIVNDPILLQKDNALPLACDSDEQSENASLFPVPILIHCRAGVSRSATLVISLVMLIKQWPLARAFLHVKKCRSTISPNFGFYRQLIHFEATLIRAGILRGDEPEFMRPSQHSLSDSDHDDVKFVWPSLNVREYLALCSSEMTAAVWEARYGTREASRYFTKPAASKQGTGVCTEAQHVSSIGISSKYHSSNVADVSSKRISSNVSTDLYKTGIKPHEVPVKYDTPSDANVTTTLSDKTSDTFNSSSASANTQPQPSGQENHAPDSVANPSPNSANSGSGFALPPFTPSPIKSRSNSPIPDSPNVSSGTPDTVCRQSSLASQGTNGVPVPADVRKQMVAVSNAADTASSTSFIEPHANSVVRSKHSQVTDAPIDTTHVGSSAGSGSTIVATTQSAWVSGAVETVSSFDQESIETDTLKHIHSNKSFTTGSAEASLSAAYLFGGKNIGASSTHTPGAITISTIRGGADEALACSTAHANNTLQTVSAAHIGTMRLTPQACDISLPVGEAGAGFASPFSDTSFYGIADGNGLRTPNMSMHSTSTHHAPQPSLSFDPAPSLNQQLSMELNKLGISTIISPRLRCLEPSDATSVNNQQSKGPLGNLDVKNNSDKVTTISDHNSDVKETSSQGIDPNLASVQASHISYFFSVRTSPEHGYVRSHVPYNSEAKPDVATSGLSKNESDQLSRSVPAPCDHGTSSTTNTNNSPQPITASKKHDKIRQIHDVSISVASAPYVRSTVNPRFPWLARRIPAREVAVQMRKASENGFWFDSTEAKNFVVASTPQLGVGTGYFGLRNPYLPMQFSGDSMFEIAYNQKKHLLNKKSYGFDASPPKIASTLERVSHASATLQSNVRKVSSMISLSTANGQKSNIDELNKTYKNSSYNKTISPQKQSHSSKKTQIFPSVKSLAHSASSVKLSVVLEDTNRSEPAPNENHTQYDVHQSHSTDQNISMQHQSLNSTKKQHSTPNIDHATPSTHKKKESIVQRHRRHSFGV